MDENQQREAIKTVYSSQSWRDKVDAMSPEQITAVYLRFVREGKLG